MFSLRGELSHNKCPSPLLAPCLIHRFFYLFFYYFLLFIAIIIFSPDQKILVTCHHRHEPRTMGPTTPTGRRPPQSGTPCRGQHLRRRAPPQGDREERTGTVGAPAAAPPNQVGREGRISTIGSLAAAPPNRAVREDKTGAADAPAAAHLGTGRRKASGAETTNAANEPVTPHGSTPVAAAAHAADVNTPLGTTHESKGVGPVNTT